MGIYFKYTYLEQGEWFEAFGKEIVNIVNVCICICICLQERCGGQLAKVHERHVGGPVCF